MSYLSTAIHHPYNFTPNSDMLCLRCHPSGGTSADGGGVKLHHEEIRINCIAKHVSRCEYLRLKIIHETAFGSRDYNTDRTLAQGLLGKLNAAEATCCTCTTGCCARFSHEVSQAVQKACEKCGLVLYTRKNVYR
jgi:hypothetical protein